MLSSNVAITATPTHSVRYERFKHKKLDPDLISKVKAGIIFGLKLGQGLTASQAQDQGQIDKVVNTYLREMGLA